ncbi:MAG: hypothetical protein IJ354_05130 [Clostridia bacterium]|nr:hypothetical protein [Clostridia bacterium]
MKHFTLFLLAMMMILPSISLAQPAEPMIDFTYNGQQYECTYSAFEKCCSEADTSYDVWLNPIGCAEIESINLSVPTTARGGDVFDLKQGDAVKYLTLYAVGPDGMQHYVSMPGSLFGTGLISEKDHYRLNVNAMEFINGKPRVNASISAAFLNGEVNFQINFDLQLQ